MYKILIVEDDRVIADKMKEHLEKWDYEVACVQDFKRVQEEYTAFDPQLVIMDIILPFIMDFTGVPRFVRSPVCRSCFYHPQVTI